MTGEQDEGLDGRPPGAQSDSGEADRPGHGGDMTGASSAHLPRVSTDAVRNAADQGLRAGKSTVGHDPSSKDEEPDRTRPSEASRDSEPPTRPRVGRGGAKSRNGDREGVGYGAFAVFRRVRDATRAVRRPLKPALNAVLLPVASLLAFSYIALINRTVRFEWVGPRHDEPLHAAGEPVIYAFFHSRLFSMFRVLRGRRVAVLVALGDIGDVISSAVRLFGHKPVRGARSGGAARALVEAIREIREGRSAAFAVDGPRGPREVVKSGVVYAAQKSGCAIVPIATAAKRKWNLGIWDRHEIPHPFTKTIVVMASPVRVPRGASREELEGIARALEGTLQSLGAMAADRVKRY